MCCHSVYFLIFKLKFQMNKPSKYTDELLRFLDNEENYPDMIEWIEQLPALAQPDVLSEIKAAFKDRYLDTSEQHWLDKAKLIANGIGDFEEEIMTKKLDKILLIMKFKDLVNDSAKLEMFITNSREKIINRILSDPYCDKNWWILVHKIIEVEKVTELYHPANWSKIIRL